MTKDDQKRQNGNSKQQTETVAGGEDFKETWQPASVCRSVSEARRWLVGWLARLVTSSQNSTTIRGIPAIQVIRPFEEQDFIRGRPCPSDCTAQPFRTLSLGLADKGRAGVV